MVARGSVRLGFVTRPPLLKYKTQEFTGLDKAVSDLSSDRATAKTELDAVMEYYGKLTDRCIAKPEAYEERKQRREAEVAGLNFHEGWMGYAK